MVNEVENQIIVVVGLLESEDRVGAERKKFAFDEQIFRSVCVVLQNFN